MTLLTAWTTYDSRAPSSAYIATDSRISFLPGRETWDHARKCFASAQFPDLFGYVGEVLLPSHVLNQYVSAIDMIGENAKTQTFELRNQHLVETVTEALANFPNKRRGDFEIVHIGREGEGLGSVFHTRVISSVRGTVDVSSLSSPDQSAVLEFGTAYVREAEPVLMRGSGTGVLRTALGQWNASEHAFTSRTAFSAHCDAIASGAVATVGGHPQLVGLIRKGNGLSFGVVTGDGTQALAFRSLASLAGDSVPYRNEVFEVVDSAGILLAGAARHRRPSSSPPD